MKQSSYFSRAKIFTAVLLIAFGAIGRYLLKDIPNVETITTVTLLAGSLLGGPWTFVVGLVTVGITDIAIGNTNILLYTWSAWAAMGFFGWVLRKREKKPLRHSLELTGMGLLGNIFFYVWTNFGVWQLSGMYAKTWEGLVACYIAAIPFLKMQLLSTVMIVPLVSVVTLYVWNAYARRATQPAATQQIATDTIQ